MENKDFATNLIVKEFSKCCSFYRGIFPDMKVSIVASFLMQFTIPFGRTFRIIDANQKADTPPAAHAVLDFKLAPSGIERAVEYLMQHDLKFITENNVLRTMDPAGNILILSGSDICSISAMKTDGKTRKVQIS